jgi:hypothetical protein
MNGGRNFVARFRSENDNWHGKKAVGFGGCPFEPPNGVRSRAWILTTTITIINHPSPAKHRMPELVGTQGRTHSPFTLGASLVVQHRRVLDLKRMRSPISNGGERHQNRLLHEG